MIVKMTKDGQEALLQAGTESHRAYLNSGWVQGEEIEAPADEIPPEVNSLPDEPVDAAMIADATGAPVDAPVDAPVATETAATTRRR